MAKSSGKTTIPGSIEPIGEPTIEPSQQASEPSESTPSEQVSEQPNDTETVASLIAPYVPMTGQTSEQSDAAKDAALARYRRACGVALTQMEANDLVASVDHVIAAERGNYFTATKNVLKEAVDALDACKEAVDSPAYLALASDVDAKRQRADAKRQRVIEALSVKTACMVKAGKTPREYTVETVDAQVASAGTPRDTRKASDPAKRASRPRGSHQSASEHLASTATTLLANISNVPASADTLSDLQLAARASLAALLSHPYAGPILYGSLAGYVNQLAFPGAIVNPAQIERDSALASLDSQINALAPIVANVPALAPTLDALRSQRATLAGQPIPATFQEPSEGYAWGALPMPEPSPVTDPTMGSTATTQGEVPAGTPISEQRGSLGGDEPYVPDADDEGEPIDDEQARANAQARKDAGE